MFPRPQRHSNSVSIVWYNCLWLFLLNKQLFILWKGAYSAERERERVEDLALKKSKLSKTFSRKINLQTTEQNLNVANK